MCMFETAMARQSSGSLGMSTSPKSVRFDDDTMWVGLTDGRTIAVPLAWFPRLLEATQEQRAQATQQSDEA